MATPGRPNEIYAPKLEISRLASKDTDDNFQQVASTPGEKRSSHNLGGVTPRRKKAN